MTSHALSHLSPHTGDLLAHTHHVFQPVEAMRENTAQGFLKTEKTEVPLMLKTSVRIPEGGSVLGGCSPAAWQCLGRQGVVCPSGTLPDSPDWP